MKTMIAVVGTYLEVVRMAPFIWTLKKAPYEI
jgi:hypothetical protein